MAIERERNGIMHIQAYDPITERTNSITTGLANTPENYDEIQKRKLQVEAEIKEKKLLKKRIGGKMFIKNLVDQYINACCHLALSTQRTKAKVLTYLNAKIKMQEPASSFINQVNITSVINDIYTDPKLMPSTKALYVNTVFDLVKFSNEQGYTKDVKIPKSLKPVRQGSHANPFTDKILEEIVNHPRIKFDCFRLAHIYVCLYQGLRPNEVIKIDPAKIDFQNQVMTIDFQKTKNSRVVPIHPAVLPILEYLVEKYSPTKGLFHYTYDYIAGIFHSVLKDMGLREKKFRYYCLRSTHVTRGQFNGVRDDSVAYWLGHSIRNTRSTYYLNVTCETAAIDMKKIFFQIPNYFEVLGIEDKSEALKKELSTSRFKSVLAMFPDIIKKEMFVHLI